MTSAHPWQADRVLDLAKVATLIHQVAPTLEITALQMLGEGWDNQGFEVNRTWVFRFPKRADVLDAFWLEVETLPRLAQALPVAVPEIEWVGEPSPAFPLSIHGLSTRTWRWCGFSMPCDVVIKATPSAFETRSKPCWRKDRKRSGAPMTHEASSWPNLQVRAVKRDDMTDPRICPEVARRQHTVIQDARNAMCEHDNIVPPPNS